MADTLDTHSTRSWWDKERGKWIHHTVHQHPGADGQPVRDTYRDGKFMHTRDVPQQEPPCPNS